MVPVARLLDPARARELARCLPSGETSVVCIAAGRMAFGAAALVAPRWFARAWIGPDAATRGVPVITRSCAIRDLALGLGALIALRRGRSVRGWVEAGILCDAVDALVIAAGPIEGRKKATVAGAALAGVAGGIVALLLLDAD
jgi:hypothetical protein